MEILFSAILGGLLTGLSVLILRKKYQRFAILPAVLLVPLINNSPLQSKILGYFSPKYRVQSIMGEKLKVLFEHPVVKKELEQGPDHAQAYSFLLTRQGIKHLEMNDLDRWNEYRILLSEKDIFFCSGLLKGNLTEDKMMNALGLLTDDELQGFAALMAKGGLRKLNNEGNPQTHADYFRQSIETFQKNMSEEEKVKFQKGITFAARISDQEACWIVKKILTESKKLPEEERSKMLKFLAGI